MNNNAIRAKRIRELLQAMDLDTLEAVRTQDTIKIKENNLVVKVNYVVKNPSLINSEGVVVTWNNRCSLYFDTTQENPLLNQLLNSFSSYVGIYAAGSAIGSVLIDGIPTPVTPSQSVIDNAIELKEKIDGLIDVLP